VRVLAVLIALAGCARDPAPAECPSVAPGDLVVTEIRGPQSGADALGTWVELYNASGGDLDLKGTRLVFRKKDGSSETDVLVRRSVDAPAGGYTVLGLFADVGLPAYVDYGFAGDFHTSFLPAAALDVEACGQLIDRVVYDSLPSQGSYELGTAPPDANANDLPASWCTDATMSAGTYPGTPQQPNPPCP
jgi:hypothetical protein